MSEAACLRLAFLWEVAKRDETVPINGCCHSSIAIQEHTRGRTGFEGNGHGVYDGADRRPDFLREFDLILFWVVRDG